MQAMKRGFRGVFYSICLDSNYWCAKTSQKMSNPRICWSWGRAAPIGREKAEFVGKMHPKSLEGHVWYDDSLFSVRTNLICKRFLVFFVVCCFGSVEVSWAGENAGDTHLKKSLALLLRVRPRSFCFNDVICTFEAIDAMNWCRDGEDMIPRSQPNVPLRFFLIEYQHSWSHFCFAKQIRALSLLYMLEWCQIDVWVCPESGRTLTCMYREGENGSMQSLFVRT